MMTASARLDRMREQHDQSTSAGYRENVRATARSFARKCNLPIPQWAEPRRRGGAPAPLRAPVAAPALAVPRELSEWRERTPGGAAVRISRTGVELHALGEKPRRFKTIQAAIEFARAS